MATIVLSAVGAAVGGSLGGTVLGLSGAVIGRAIGATVGRVIDQKLLGAGSAAVETGRLERYRITGASEGSAVAQVFGRIRVGGQVIWSTPFREHSSSSGGGKGGGGTTVTQYSYSVSLAVALCEGEITRVGRVWADGTELAVSRTNMRVYTGSEDQLPDPLIEAVEGVGLAPAYRGIAYVVFEDLDLQSFGNRVPQLTFEVIRATDADNVPEDAQSLSQLVQAVALMPGTGEYALATTPVHFTYGIGFSRFLNTNTASGVTDMDVALDQLVGDLPACRSVSLIVSWFGDDLRVGNCKIRPKVEQLETDAVNYPWFVSGQTRELAESVPVSGDSPVYGGTPTDRSVIDAIEALRARGQRAVFYPFILMEQMLGNTLPNPWTAGTPGQPHLPWRGRITTSLAPDQAGSVDGSAAAEAEVAAFFGTAQPWHFISTAEGIDYLGPQEWSFRRFILHYAHLCQRAGGVDAFCIGSEMRGLTRIRGENNSFPAVEQLRQLATDVRGILGPETKIGYAADWSEYFGYHPQDGSGDVFFHLDPLWADPAIDFVGIDNYMPLADWRDGDSHADAEWGSIYNQEYLKANVAGGEGYDWYYADEAARDAQVRTPIEDGAHGEPWVFRYKDIRNWWSLPHHERVGGVRKSEPSAWQPQSKPIWFTEFGCAAIDKGANQPNKFLDPKSSESRPPWYSSGVRDDLMQAQALRAVLQYWASPSNNPISGVYGAPMVDLERAHVWAWDARPYPHFPGLGDVWADGPNYSRGHWLSGRASNENLAAVVSEICRSAGVDDIDVSELHGLVRGYAVESPDTARSALQPLLLAHGLSVAERDGQLVFRMRGGTEATTLDPDQVAAVSEIPGLIEQARSPSSEGVGRLRLNYVIADGDYDVSSVEATSADETLRSVSESDLPLALTPSEARQTVDRWLAEEKVAHDTIRLALPPSLSGLGAGDVVQLNTQGEFRIDSVEYGDVRMLEAVRVEPSAYVPGEVMDEIAVPRTALVRAVPMAMFLDLPLLTGDEAPHAPHVAVTATPWPGPVAVVSSSQDAGYRLNSTLTSNALIGQTVSDLSAAPAGIWDRGPSLRVRTNGGVLSSADPDAVLAGANALAIGSGEPDGWEVLQFAKAELVGPDLYDLSMRLRGQAGTDASMPDVWPVGSYVVALDAALEQILLPSGSRGREHHYRIGPAALGYDDPSYVHQVRAFEGVGLRPYAPVHLRATYTGGNLHLSWVRRTRIDGDVWSGDDVPLAEAQERYRVHVWSGQALLREQAVDVQEWTYSLAMQNDDGAAGPVTFAVAQVSDRFGAGLWRRITVNV